MSNSKPTQDPETGFVYETQAEYLRAIGMNRNLIRSRRRRGVPESLLLFPGSLALTSSRDHEGREFASITAMCRFWKISRKLYMERIRQGWTVKRALTSPARRYRQLDIAFEGRIFNSYRDLAAYLGINEATVRSRLWHGWALSDLRISTESHDGHKRQRRSA